MTHTVSSARTPVAVGIDVAKDTLRVCIRHDDGTERALGIGNVEADLTDLARTLAGFRGKVVLESTGHYHWLAALTLTEAHCDVRVINPILTKKYTGSTIRKVKTDPADARMLAEIALREEHLPTRFSMDRNGLAVRKQLNAISSLTKALHEMEATLRSVDEAHEVLGTTPFPAIEAIQQTVQTLRKQIRTLESEFTTVAQEHDRERIERFDTIPGVSLLTAAIVAHWCAEAPEQSVRSWVAFTGLDVSVRQSGVWRGKGKLTKRGSPYLRKRLYQAAWGAVMNDDAFQERYRALRSRGRSHVAAVNIIARKLIRTMFMLDRNQCAYDPALAFAPTA